ncbi:MAG TPA: PxKF domain-containing protein, partial [candidate division Zixibacteria bacterium]|nr:PxKF domain-containing protein [candidate division Zixibacteria bacterium]
ISTASAAEIRGIKWDDSNGNGTMDAGELGVNNVSICFLSSTIPNSCTSTDTNGNYSFSGLPIGTYIVYEILPSGTVRTYPAGSMGSNWTIISGAPYVVTLSISDETRSGINFGNRNLIPPPSDVSIEQQSGLTEDGIPMVLRPSLTSLTIRKDLSSISNVLSVKLTMTWIDGTIITADMINNSGIWQADIAPPFPGGTAQMKFEVDIEPLGSDNGDMIQIGDIIFIDPSGEIRNSCTVEPIEGATVSLYVMDPLTGSFSLSPAENQRPSDNPLTTGVDGRYFWMTKFGVYQVKAEKTNFVTSWSHPVMIPPPVFDLNIYLTPIGGCDPAGRIGFLQPINGDGSSIFKLKSTIPVKFQKWDENGNFITDAVAKIYLSKITDTVLGSEIEAISTSEETTGNLFRYDSTDNQYIFNLGTKKLSTGTWQIRIEFNDGTDKVVKVSLK